MTGLHEDFASFEKLRRAEAATKIALWTEQGSWEGPLREFAKISNPDNDLDRRLKFFRWEVTSRVEQAVTEFSMTPATVELELEALNTIFFEDLGFRLEGASAALDTVLAKRAAPPALLAMLYAWVAEVFFRALRERNRNSEPRAIHNFVKRIDLVFGTPSDVVRAFPYPEHDFGRVMLVDLKSKGQTVDDGVWCHWAQNSNNGFSPKSMTEALIGALTELFVSLDRGNVDFGVHDSNANKNLIESLHRQLSILDFILALQPSETQRLADRAILNTRLGQRQNALSDLKRYFAFHDRSKAPAVIISLFEKLNSNANQKGTEWN